MYGASQNKVATPYTLPTALQPTTTNKTSFTPVPVTAVPVSGRITTQASQPSKPVIDTLDEPVSVTIMRDLKNIGWKLKQVLLPGGNTKHLLKDWDLWGPLILCLALSIRLSLGSSSQGDLVFTYAFAIVWVGAAVVTLNSKLLGGRLSFFQSICVLGYCICPLVLAAFLTIPIKVLPSGVNGFLKLGMVSFAFGWSVFASGGFLSDINLDKRKALAMYPIYFFYFVLAWLVSFFS